MFHVCLEDSMSIHYTHVGLQGISSLEWFALDYVGEQRRNRRGVSSKLHQRKYSRPTYQWRLLRQNRDRFLINLWT